MAFRFNELPWYIQALIYFVVAVGIFLAGEYLEMSPVRSAYNERQRLEDQHRKLVAEVSRLQAVKQQHQEFRTRLEALEQQLARARTFVPEKKEADEFIRTLQASASGSQVAVRSLKSRAVVVKEFYAEMPFDVEMDGAYYDVSDFFDRLGKTTRIINASGVDLQGLGSRGSKKYDYRAGTTVTGDCVVTTYYTPSEAETAAAAPPTRGRGASSRGRRTAGGQGGAARQAAGRAAQSGGR